ncbi:MAG TPA: hypothetical protein PKZ76_10985 [Xanthomonadaceae bacterium]|nr:hypothetical protein [Xanthomonadaceae bacterium]
MRYALTLIVVVFLAACAHRQVAHFDPGDADAATVAKVQRELQQLGFRVQPMDVRAREPGPDRVVYGHEVDIAAIGYRLHQVLGRFVQTLPTVRGTHSYSARHVGVYLARASMAAPREFSGTCGDHFARVLLWQEGIARVETQLWDDERSGFFADEVHTARWQDVGRLRVFLEETDVALAQLADARPGDRFRPPLLLTIGSFSSDRPCRLPERRIPEAIPPGGTHRANADRM